MWNAIERFARSSLFTAVLLVSIWPAAGGLAQGGPNSDDVQSKIQELQSKLDQLNQQAREIQAALDAIRSQAGLPAAPEPQAPEDLAEIQAPLTQPPTDLGEVAPIQPVDATAPGETAMSDVGVLQNPSTAAASKVFNPDISAIGNFIARAGSNRVEDGDSASLAETELGFEAFVDPYAKAKFFASFSPEGAEIEEGYINFITLPAGLTAKVGKLRADFGKVNTMHTHVRPWVDQPLVMQNFFGDEGLLDSGVSLSQIIPNRFNLFIEGTAEVYRGDVTDIFAPRSRNDLFYLGHLKIYRDISDNSNLELGSSWARGTLPDPGGSNQFGGLDLTYRWKPLHRSIYSSFVGRTEIIANDRDDQAERAWGFYTSADYQFARRWFAGVRLDQSDHPEEPSRTDRGASLSLTFWPSEFTQLRTQLRRTDYDGEKVANEVLFQLNFSIGAHGAHTF